MSAILNITGDVYLPQKYVIDFKLDNVVCNFEFPLSTSGPPAKNKVNLGTDTSYLLETFLTPPLAVNLANNHIMDYGKDGYLATIEYLTANNIKFFGAGNDNNNYNNPCLINLGDKKIALFGYSCQTTSPVFGGKENYGSAKIDTDKIIDDIQKQRQQVDVIIINLHWGLEEIPFPTFADVQIARALIDNGADMVIGHHAHVIQSHEIYKGKPIYYGLGNFIFPDLDVPSYYNGDIFESRYLKKQAKSNKESLLIKYNIETLEAEEHKVRFDNNKVILANKRNLPSYIPKNNEEFEKKLRNYRRVLMLKRFMAEPKLPNISHLKRFIGID